MRLQGGPVSRPVSYVQGCAISPARALQHKPERLHDVHTQTRLARCLHLRRAQFCPADPALTAEKYLDVLAPPPSVPHTIQVFSSTSVPKKDHRVHAFGQLPRGPLKWDDSILSRIECALATASCP